jgi:hypothetical protein
VLTLLAKSITTDSSDVNRLDVIFGKHNFLTTANSSDSKSVFNPLSSGVVSKDKFILAPIVGSNRGASILKRCKIEINRCHDRSAFDSASHHSILPTEFRKCYIEAATEACGGNYPKGHAMFATWTPKWDVAFWKGHSIQINLMFQNSIRKGKFSFHLCPAEAYISSHPQSKLMIFERFVRSLELNAKAAESFGLNVGYVILDKSDPRSKSNYHSDLVHELMGKAYRVAHDSPVYSTLSGTDIQVQKNMDDIWNDVIKALYRPLQEEGGEEEFASQFGIYHSNGMNFSFLIV